MRFVVDTGMMKPQEWRERRFAEGAAALRRYHAATGRPHDLPPTGEHYVCPCCMSQHGREALSNRTLTIEDVPPKSVGGRWLVLTCEKCNSTAGTRLDAQARLREEQLDFLGGRAPDQALTGKIMVDESMTRGDISHVDDAFLLFVDPRRSDPRQHAEMMARLDQAAAGNRPDGQIGFELTKQVDLVRARLSWLRAAYLVAFAALGWPYVYMPYLAQLRAQLADPDAKLLPPLALADPAAMPYRRDLVVVQEPYELRSLAVVLGRYTVFLPGLEDPQPFMSLGAALSKLPGQLISPGAPGRKQIPWRGKRISWPTRPMYALHQ
jgi:hypothetical protein